MGTAPAALLIKLEPGREVAAGSVRGLGKELAALVAAGWVASRKDGRVVMVQLTEAGVAERAAAEAAVAAAAAAKPVKARAVKAKAATGATAARGGKAATATVRLAALEEAVAALTARLAALEAHRPAAPAPAPAPAPPIDPDALRAALLAAIGDVDASTRAGGLVPIPAVRAELRRRGVAAGDGDVNAALDALEHAWVIDLSIAQDPSAVADRAAGIERPGRGLLYYVARR